MRLGLAALLLVAACAPAGPVVVVSPGLAPRMMPLRPVGRVQFLISDDDGSLISLAFH